LIFDEIITGMRWSRHGAQGMYGVTPDLSTWGKALGNGFAVSAWPGSGDLMEAGGLNTDASRVFLLSTTNGAETTGLAAYLAVSAAYAERDVVAEIEIQGTKLRSGLEKVTEEPACRSTSPSPAAPRAWYLRPKITTANRLRLFVPFSSRSC
jgi:glutamate-1-semialdehyde 2,1-aminomutase